MFECWKQCLPILQCFGSLTPSYTFTGLLRGSRASLLGSHTIAVFMGSVLLTALTGPGLVCYLLHYHPSTDDFTVLL